LNKYTGLRHIPVYVESLNEFNVQILLHRIMVMEVYACYQINEVNVT